jgi:class 3 adenylate cyclase
MSSSRNDDAGVDPMKTGKIATTVADTVKLASSVPTAAELALSGKLNPLGSVASIAGGNLTTITTPTTVASLAASAVSPHLASTAHNTSIHSNPLVTAMPASLLASTASSPLAASTVIQPPGLDPSVFTSSSKLSLGNTAGLSAFDTTASSVKFTTESSLTPSVLGMPAAPSAISLAGMATPQSTILSLTTPNPLLSGSTRVAGLESVASLGLDSTRPSYFATADKLYSTPARLSPFVNSSIASPWSLQTDNLNAGSVLNFTGRPASSLFAGQPASSYLTDLTRHTGTVLQLPISTGINATPIFTEPSAASKIADYEDKVRALRQELKDLASRAEKEAEGSRQKSETIQKLEDKGRELQEQMRFAFLLSHVSTAAATQLVKLPKLGEQFEKAERCEAFVMSVDIRRSTEMMLRASSPEAFALFITALCGAIESIIKDTFGVVDKFTGDGVLAFYPYFFSGQDAGYYAVQAAERCHAAFDRIYREHRSSFTSVLADVGLGIGIDFGEVHLAKMAGSITVVGAAVVHACRLGGAPKGVTLVNQQGFDKMQARFGKHCSTAEFELSLKDNVKVLAYHTKLTDAVYPPEVPEWARSAAEESKAK